MYADQQMKQNAPQWIGGNIIGENAIRKPEVEGEMDRLMGAVESLAIVTDNLTARLSAIRRQTGPTSTAGGQGVAPQSVLCPLASMIRDRREAVERYVNQLQSTLSDLEL